MYQDQQTKAGHASITDREGSVIFTFHTDPPVSLSLEPDKARSLGESLIRHAHDAEAETWAKTEEAKRKAAEAIPVDRRARQLADGSPETPDHREIDPTTGQQKGYIVLTPEERAKGFVRPVRRAYLHKRCGAITSIALAIAETYARDPKFYSDTFCVNCREHSPLDQFMWAGTDEQVGS